MTLGIAGPSYSLSPMQRGMLYHHVAAPHSGVDVEQLVFRLPEEVRPEVLVEAWRRLDAHHPALRTSFHWEGLAEPVQRVHDEVDQAFEEHDWRNLPADRLQGFDLTQPPMSRLALFRFGGEDFRLVWTFHHMLMDGRSHFSAIQEAFAAYDALLHGGEPRFEARPAYQAHIEELAGRDFSESEDFWRELLLGFSAPTPVDASQGGPPAPGREGYDSREDRLSQAATDGLRAQAEALGVTVNSLFQGAWAILLSRHSGEEDVVFGVTRACRRSTVDGADEMVGNLINTVPVRAKVGAHKSARSLAGDLRQQGLYVRPHEHTPLVMVQGWSEAPGGTPLFDSFLVFDNYLLQSALRRLGGSWERREARLFEQTNFPLAVYGYAESEFILRIDYDRARFDDAIIERMVGHLKRLLEGMAADPDHPIDLPLLSEAEERQLLLEWNETSTDYPRSSGVHQLFEEQARSTPEAVALAFKGREISYAELDARANHMAQHLGSLGVVPGDLVAICMDRSIEMMVGLLGILKAGAAYVPLDPKYPKERLAYMVEDAEVEVLVTQRSLAGLLPSQNLQVVAVDADWETIASQPAQPMTGEVTPESLVYVIYTSGSTGKPKGVMVTHQNVVNFFAGMDQVIRHDPPGVWLAVTSISFDISVLELFWTLARGFKVVIQAEDDRLPGQALSENAAAKKLDFSLFYFASDTADMTGDKYHVLMEGAKFADQHGFSAVWTPERHFHDFGGLYPSPAVVGAAIAAVTDRVRIRAGSVVLPLNDPIRIAEEWSVVDNLSHGRVGISFASGWHANDFVLAPGNYSERNQLMYDGIEEVRRLWRGETIRRKGGADNEIDVAIQPLPIQPELPVWVTSGGSPGTFRQAGAIGANLLTHLLGQDMDQLAEKVALYRSARQEAGHQGEGHVTLMMHTFLAKDMQTVQEKAKGPFISYLKTSSDLVKNLAKSLGLDGDDLSDEEMGEFLEQRFDRFFETGGLMGTPESCMAMVDRIKAMGIDEVACLIDFGIDNESVLSGLELLDELRREANGASADDGDFSVAAQIERHGVTHMQCTPSMAGMMALDPDTLEALKNLRQLLIGGEAFPVSLASTLQEALPAEIVNMYGPTETTIWSSVHTLAKGAETVPIGRPIVNTQLYVLDGHMRPVPVGVPGELYIGGDGVTPGYLNRPKLTRERFVPNPFGAKDDRLYATGDLVRYMPGGATEFLGRMDHQVKIRGHRIELGEVEAVLAQHHAVRETVAIVREDAPGSPRLIAYVAPVVGEDISAGDLRAYVAERLPEPMVPSAFVTMSQFPRTPNQKIDRKALPAPDGEATDGPSRLVEPATATERTMAEIWRRVLNVGKVGGQSNFFDLGGHSLLAIRLVSAIRDRFGVKIPLKALFATPTVAGLALAVEERQIEEAGTEEVTEALAQIQQMSDEEVKALLTRQSTNGPEVGATP